MSSQTAPGQQSYPRPTYAWYVVFVLFVAYTFSFIDRQIVSLLVTPITRDLGLGDTEFGLLSGTAFAFLYTVLGIPFGRMADSKSRRGLIMFGITFWSLATAACGVAKNFWSLFAARVGVGVGEATLSPAAHSMIADYFPPNRLGRAISIYGMGIYIGAGLAFIVGGVVVQALSAGPMIDLPVFGEIYPWQRTFFLVGFPGLLVVLLMLTVREPVRHHLKDGASLPSIHDVVRFVLRHKGAYFSHLFGYAFLALIGYTWAAWVIAFFERSHGSETGPLAIQVGIAAMTAQTAGIVFGGEIGDRLRARGKSDGYFISTAVAAALTVPLAFLIPYLPSEGWAILFMYPFGFITAMPFGAGPAAIQELTPPAMRSQMSAIYIFVVNVIGLAMGPPLVGAITEFVYQDPNMLDMSLAIVLTIAAVISTIVLVAGRKAYRAAIAERLQQTLA